MTRRFFTLDVFTETALSGNPLAVVLDAEGLDDAPMQAIAAEFNLSETVFVLDPRTSANTASLRIFTPARELPFAGHPTIGTAALLAHVRQPDLLARQDVRIVLEERVGDIACVVRHRSGARLPANSTCRSCPRRSQRRRPPKPRSPRASALIWRTSASTGTNPASSAPEPPIFSFPSARSRRCAAPGLGPCPGRAKRALPPTSTRGRWQTPVRHFTRGCLGAAGV
jgi:predicted PhzF superfamily epimerase YddE/YHI9